VFNAFKVMLFSVLVLMFISCQTQDRINNSDNNGEDRGRIEPDIPTNPELIVDYSSSTIEYGNQAKDSLLAIYRKECDRLNISNDGFQIHENTARYSLSGISHRYDGSNDPVAISFGILMLKRENVYRYMTNIEIVNETGEKYANYIQIHEEYENRPDLGKAESIEKVVLRDPETGMIVSTGYLRIFSPIYFRDGFVLKSAQENDFCIDAFIKCVYSGTAGGTVVSAVACISSTAGYLVCLGSGWIISGIGSTVGCGIQALWNSIFG
jgi:hypothetical protein